MVAVYHYVNTTEWTIAHLAHRVNVASALTVVEIDSINSGALIKDKCSILHIEERLELITHVGCNGDSDGLAHVGRSFIGSHCAVLNVGRHLDGKRLELKLGYNGDVGARHDESAVLNGKYWIVNTTTGVVGVVHFFQLVAYGGRDSHLYLDSVVLQCESGVDGHVGAWHGEVIVAIIAQYGGFNK